MSSIRATSYTTAATPLLKGIDADGKSRDKQVEGRIGEISKNASPTKLKITRFYNACVLIEMGEHTILTDPFFVNAFYFGITEKVATERVAMEPQDLPPLTAIIGCHSVSDHWQMEKLADYSHNKDNVSVFVATESMRQSAIDYGFQNAEVLDWGDQRTIAESLSIETVEAKNMMGTWKVNNYVLRCGRTSVFFGTEARDLPPFVQHNATYGPVDIAILPVNDFAILPVNGVHLLGLYKLVFTGAEAVKATEALGSKTLFVIHDAHSTIFPVAIVKSSGDDADIAAAEMEDPIEVIRKDPGVLWTMQPQLEQEHGQSESSFASSSS